MLSKWKHYADGSFVRPGQAWMWSDNQPEFGVWLAKDGLSGNRLLIMIGVCGGYSLYISKPQGVVDYPCGIVFVPVGAYSSLSGAKDAAGRKFDVQPFELLEAELL